MGQTEIRLDEARFLMKIRLATTEEKEQLLLDLQKDLTKIGEIYEKGKNMVRKFIENAEKEYQTAPVEQKCDAPPNLVDEDKIEADQDQGSYCLQNRDFSN